MLECFIDYFKKPVYKESAFFIKKSKENVYFLKAKNGLYANIHFDNNNMYVCVFMTNDKNKKIEKLSYFSKKSDKATSVIDFIIQSIRNNIVFYLNKKDIDHFLVTNANLSNDDFIYKMLKYHFNHHEKNQYNYSFSFFNDKKYVEVNFSKKRVIGNIYKFKFYKVCVSGNYTEMNINYIINNELFELSTMDQLKKSVTERKSTNRKFFSLVSPKSKVVIKESYGFDGNLNESMNSLIKLCDLKKIRLLKKGNDFCFFARSKNKLILRYLTDYNIFESELRNLNNRIIYFGNNLVLMTYTAKEITVEKSEFGFRKAMDHQFDILSMVSNKLDYFTRYHPSEYVLKTLAALGMSCETPLSNEDLKIVEMFEV